MDCLKYLMQNRQTITTNIILFSAAYITLDQFLGGYLRTSLHLSEASCYFEWLVLSALGRLTINYDVKFLKAMGKLKFRK